MFKRFFCLILIASIIVSIAWCQLSQKWKKEEPAASDDIRRYTGGFLWEEHAYDNTEIHWVETFEEAMIAIEHIEAAGNKFDKTVLSSYENEEIDAKYCFVMNTYKSKALQEGQEWYDREQLGSVRVFYIGFVEKITIEELEYSYYNRYKHIEVDRGQKEAHSSINVAYACSECQTVENEDWAYMMNEFDMCYVIEESTDNIIAKVYYYRMENHTEELPDDFHDEFCQTIVSIGG